MIVFPEHIDLQKQQRFSELIISWLESDNYLCKEDFDDCLHNLYSGRFPDWPLLQQRERCERVAPELLLMARSQYRHHLTALHQHFLIRSAEAWLEIAREEKVPDAEDCQALVDAMEEWRDVFDVEFYVVSFMENPLATGLVGIDLEDVLELMPLDIADEVETRLEARHTDSPGDLAEREEPSPN